MRQPRFVVAETTGYLGLAGKRGGPGLSVAVLDSWHAYRPVVRLRSESFNRYGGDDRARDVAEGQRRQLEARYGRG